MNMNNNHNQNRNNRQNNINSIRNINQNKNQNVRANAAKRPNTPKNYANHLSRQKKLRQQRRKRTSLFMKFGFRFLMFLFFFVVVGGIFLAVFFFNLTKLQTPQDILYTVNTPQIKNSKSQNIQLSYDVGFANGQYYFPVNGIMETMEFGLAGDEKEFSFFRDKTGEYVKFTADSSIVYINDEKYHLSAPSFADGNNNIYVPLEFLENTFENLQFSFDEKDNNKITIDILDISQPCFKIQQAKRITPAQESEAPYFSGDPINFISDLTEYEKYFNPPGDKISEYLILINQTHLLGQDYLASDLTDLVDTRKDGRATQQMRLYPAMALEAFLIEARANGFSNITVTSAYRSYAYQTQLFNEKVAEYRPVYGDQAEVQAALLVAYPGHSEHQSGLCVDMHSLGSALQSYGSEPDGKWLAENAHYFGFIVRYPEGKTDITGISYEPWHFRYVGRFHATKIYELGLCFDEYWEEYLNK